jgi:hypothetical protein
MFAADIVAPAFRADPPMIAVGVAIGIMAWFHHTGSADQTAPQTAAIRAPT